MCFVSQVVLPCEWAGTRNNSLRAQRFTEQREVFPSSLTWKGRRG
ncbi:hypothetical protein Cadr_000024132 [Camelus dromedarius]|uniref:Uncharacterized protein n=1 Tax=Camelus dromedarius TaxID=9838 RepID=A0A5N4CY73_CAMDR|nr:hypothetical protein Cadr_000024132 [Camelus dromedarius]